MSLSETMHIAREFMRLHKSFLQEMADLVGDHEKSQKLQAELDELEERADQLDRQRTQTINSIR